MKEMRAFSPSPEIKEFSKAEELSGGNIGFKDMDEGLMHSVLENDKETIEEGKLIADAINQGITGFIPDMMFDRMVKDYSMARQLYGETLIRLLTSYEPGYINKNIKIPEFRRELKERIKEKMQELKSKGVIDGDGTINKKGTQLAALALYTEELDNIVPKGITGEKVHKKRHIYGDKENVRGFRKGDRDIAIKSSVKSAIRRGHERISEIDLKVHEREARGQIYVVYAIDSSGSMKGKKLELAKKAGIALAYKAIDEKDKVGLIVFGKEIKSEVLPTNDFEMLLKEITTIKAQQETDMAKTISKALTMFPNEHVTKHLIMLTDALPTVGENPEEETMKEVSKAASAGITISVIGVQLDKKGKELAEKITALASGRLYAVRDIEKLDKVILEDYYSVV